MKYCSKCGSNMNDNSMFCQNCGKSFNTNQCNKNISNDSLIFKYKFSSIDLTQLLQVYKDQPENKIIKYASKSLKNECGIPLVIAKQVIKRAYYGHEVMEVNERTIEQYKKKNILSACLCIGMTFLIFSLVNNISHTKDPNITSTSASESKIQDSQDQDINENKTEIRNPASKSTIFASCDKLYQDYENSAIVANLEYRYKTIETSGRTCSIYREINAHPYVNLEANGNSWENIRTTFNKKQEKAVTKLKKGQIIKVKGTCKGFLPISHVTLDNREITGE